MAERVVAVRVDAKVSGAVAGLRKVKASVDDLTKADVTKPQKAFDDLANKGALMGGVVALGIGKAISSFAEFDQAMSAVAANSGAAGQQLEALRAQAIKLGSDTQFSATQAAQGINELAKAGVSSQQILNGGLKGALDLAAAGQIDVAQAAETTASALNQFGLNGNRATHVADLLANAANAAQGGVGDMGMALNQAGVAANAAGLNIDETTTLLALFAKAGMTGSDAGTSLKTMMQRLSAPTADAAETLKSLGISAYDAQGQFVGAKELLRQLSEQTKNLSTEQRMAAFNVIFGSDAIRAASIAAKAGADGYAEMTKEVTKAGGAAENAAKLTDNLKGDLERLGGSIDTAFISSGSSANGALRSLVQGLGGLVDAVANVPAPVLLAGGALGTLALALPKGISTYKNFTQSLDTMGLSMEKVSNKAPRLGTALRGLQGVMAGLTIATIAGSITSAFVDLADVKFDPQSIADGTVTLEDFNKKMRDTSDLGVPLRGTLEDFGQVIEATFNAGAGQEIDSFFAKINSNFGVENVSDIEVASQRFQQMDQVLSALVAGGKGDAAKRMFDQITAAAAVQGVSVDEVKSKLPQYAQAVIDAGNASSDAAPQMGEVSKTAQEIQKGADDAKKALDGLKSTIEGFGSPLAAQRAAQRDFADAVDAAKKSVKSQTDELVKQRLESEKIDPAKATKKQIAAAEAWAASQIKAGAGLDQATEAGRKNQETLDGIRERALKAASTTFELTHSQELAAAEVQKGRDAFIAQATQLGLNSDAAATLADNLGLVPKDVKTAIGLSGVDTTNATLDTITGKLTTIEGKNPQPEVKPFLNSTAEGAVEARLDKLARERTAFISISAGLTGAASGLLGGIDNIAGSVFKRATGGPIYGIGTETSDSNVLLASRNEHVWSAAEVRAAGGHAAVAALRKAVLTGGVAFRAQGGPAGPHAAYRPAPVMASSGGSRIDYDRLAGAMARQMPPMVSVYSGDDARTAARGAIRDWEWGQVQ